MFNVKVSYNIFPSGPKIGHFIYSRRLFSQKIFPWSDGREANNELVHFIKITNNCPILYMNYHTMLTVHPDFPRECKGRMRQKRQRGNLMVTS